MKVSGPFKSVERFRLFDEPPAEGEVFVAQDVAEAPGGFLVFSSNRRLMMAHMAPARLLWEVERERVLPPDNHPRPIDAWQSGSVIDLEGQRIFAVCERAGDAVVEARALLTGRLQWALEIPAPPAARWAEAQPAWPGAPTEEIEAFLAVVPEGLAVILNRTSRQVMHADSEVEVMWLPPPACQLDIRLVDPSCGRVLREFSAADVYIGALERDRFTGLHARGNHVCDIDWEGGHTRVLAEAPGRCDFPRRIGDRIVAPWRRRGEIGAIASGPDGKVVCAGWKRSGVKALAIFDAGGEPLVYVNAQTIIMLNEDLTLRWEAWAKPWVYRVCAAPGGPVFVGTAGGGGRLYGFDRDSGDVILDQKPVHQGCADLRFIDGAEWLVASFNTTRRYGFGIALVRPDGSEFQTVDVPCVVATWKGRVATSLDDDGMMGVYAL